MLTWKIVGASKASVLYIYIDDLYSMCRGLFHHYCVLWKRLVDNFDAFSLAVTFSSNFGA